MAPGDEPLYFRECAAECERLAETSGDRGARELLRYVASRWRAMADEDERQWAMPWTREHALNE
jgi:hypothetical protein